MASVPLPSWCTGLRPHQEQAIAEAVEAFKTNDVVFMDGPTGSGKTLIGERVSVELGLKTLYVASDNSLVDQFARDFTRAKVLKGKSNYPTQNFPQFTADDCTSKGPGDPCILCDEWYLCPYQKAKQAALVAPLAVTNTSFLLTEGNGPGKFSGQPLIIADEADTLEKMLMGHIEYKVGDRTINSYGMEAPGKGVHKATLIQWLVDFATKVNERANETAKKSSETAAKELRRLQILYSDTMTVMGELTKDAQREGDGKWLRDYNDRDGGLTLKPVMVDGYGTRKLWRHGRKWLLMSATLISSDEMADSLGLPLRYATVTVPMTFPAEHRPVIMAPIANVIYKEMNQAIPRLIHAIGVVLDKHPGERILVHTVSYALAKALADGIRQLPSASTRAILTYSEGRDKERVLTEYKRTPGALMLAPSMSRGIDLPDDMCRVQVIAKVPFLSTGDPQVSKRMHLPGGRMWYSIQAIRDIIQMTGRAVRSKDDWATTYIFDRQFAQNLYKENKHLFPQWWRDSVVTNQSAKEFVI